MKDITVIFKVRKQDLHFVIATIVQKGAKLTKKNVELMLANLYAIAGQSDTIFELERKLTPTEQEKAYKYYYEVFEKTFG